MTVAGQFSSVGSEHEPSAATLEKTFSSQFFFPRVVDSQEQLRISNSKTCYHFLHLAKSSVKGISNMVKLCTCRFRGLLPEKCSLSYFMNSLFLGVARKTRVLGV